MGEGNYSKPFSLSFFLLVHDNVSHRISNSRVRFIASLRKPVVGPCLVCDCSHLQVAPR